MLSRWYNWDELLGAMSDFRRLTQDFNVERPVVAAQSWPRTGLYDKGSEWVVKADVPGLTEREVNILASSEGLTLSGERKDDTPQGYSVHRQERVPYRFSRSFTFPTKIDPEKVSAAIKDGVLTVTLAKAKDSQPRRIDVRPS